MTREYVLQLRYIGVFPQPGHREYRFNIEKENSDAREVILTIGDDLFAGSSLKFQEAPDLCYQKLLSHLREGSEGDPISHRAVVTTSDVEAYRQTHPNTRIRKFGHRNRS